jgi:hypothetical protein
VALLVVKITDRSKTVGNEDISVFSGTVPDEVVFAFR